MTFYVQDQGMKKNLRKKILLVEDDELFREAVDNFLAEKYDVRFAESAEQAQEIIEAAAKIERRPRIDQRQQISIAGILEDDELHRTILID